MSKPACQNGANTVHLSTSVSLNLTSRLVVIKQGGCERGWDGLIIGAGSTESYNGPELVLILVLSSVSFFDLKSEGGPQSGK